MSMATDARALARNTPPTRERFIDGLRGLCVLAVAIGHWLVAVPYMGSDGIEGMNALASVPLARSMTWLFQVMPLFFIVGGYASAVSWSSATRAGRGYGGWLRTRLLRMLTPAALFVGVWMLAALLMALAGVSAGTIGQIVWVASIPLWFLAVYPLVVALAPLGCRRTVGKTALVAILYGVAAIVVDGLAVGWRIEVVGWANFLLVFLFAQQIGVLWASGSLRSRSASALLVAVGVVWLVVLVGPGPYPLSMVGVPGEAIQNNAPPTVALLALGLVQAGVAGIARPAGERLLQRPGPWSAAIVVNAHAMTIYLWHFTALLVATAVILPLGVFPVAEPGTAVWWAVRLAWLGLYLIPFVGLLASFGPAERRGLSAPFADTETWRSVVATFLVAGSFAWISAVGIVSASGALSPVPPVLLGAAAALLWVPRQLSPTRSTRRDPAHAAAAAVT